MTQKAVQKVALVVAATLLLIVGAGLGYRAFRQQQNASLAAIVTPNGIQESMFVPIGGIDQWVEIRGRDRRNPVILFVHGGPGGSVTPLARIFQSWEQDFTVVMWDQRCAGKTFSRNGAESCKGMSVASVAEEGVILTAYLRDHLGQDQVILLGHSWGTMVALKMTKDRPDLYSAYVGTGQVVSIAEKETMIYSATLDKLRAAQDAAAIRAMEDVGPPPYAVFQDLLVQRRFSSRFDLPSERDIQMTMAPTALFAPGWSLLELYQTFFSAQDYAGPATFDADASYDARRLGADFETPIYIFNGEFDSITPTSLAQSYLETVTAPEKAFVVLTGVGHSGVLTEPEVFLRELKAHVSHQAGSP